MPYAKEEMATKGFIEDSPEKGPSLFASFGRVVK